MRSRGADRPDDDARQQRDEQPGTGAGGCSGARGVGAAGEPEEVPQEETGWLDDLRTAKAETHLDPGPEGATSGEVRTGTGPVAPSLRRPAAGSPPAGRSPGRCRRPPATPRPHVAAACCAAVGPAASRHGFDTAAECAAVCAAACWRRGRPRPPAVTAARCLATLGGTAVGNATTGCRPRPARRRRPPAAPRPVSPPSAAPRPVSPPSAAPRPVSPPSAAPRPVSPPSAAPRPVSPPSAAPRPVSPPSAAPRPVSPPSAAPRPMSPPSAAPRSVSPPPRFTDSTSPPSGGPAAVTPSAVAPPACAGGSGFAGRGGIAVRHVRHRPATGEHTAGRAGRLPARRAGRARTRPAPHRLRRHRPAQP